MIEHWSKFGFRRRFYLWLEFWLETNKSQLWVYKCKPHKSDVDCFTGENFRKSQIYQFLKGPLENTVHDFWLMCKENGIKNVVTLCKMSTSGKKPFCFDFTKSASKKLLKDSRTFQTYQLTTETVEVNSTEIVI